MKKLAGVIKLKIILIGVWVVWIPAGVRAGNWPEEKSKRIISEIKDFPLRNKNTCF
jgi:hypothetical protein